MVSFRSMTIVSAIRLITALAVSIVSVEGAFACQCGIGPHEKNAWENAKRADQSAEAVFEGTPTKFELRWDLFDAKEGELISADAFQIKWPEREPQMVVTFHIGRTYKGNLGPYVQVHTGLGGGDCGATYMPGLNYLVYAGGPRSDQLSVSMCSPGGWLESTEIETNLRYLPNERPTSTDLAAILRWSQVGWDKQEQERHRRYAEDRRKLESATGTICGTLVRNSKDTNGGSIAFLSTLGYTPAAPPFAELKSDGSFCSKNLGPGAYYLYFVQSDDQGASALYYPGVTEVAKAIPIQVRAGRTQSNVVFKIATESAYTVRGFVSAEDKSGFDSGVRGGTLIALIRSDGDRRVWYGTTANVLLPRLAYFKFDDVVPGRYFAFVQGPAGWMSRKVVVDVASHSKLIAIDLVRNKQ